MKRTLVIVSWLCLTSSAGADECRSLDVFENPAHDAPQRLIYRLLGTSTPGAPELEVRVEGGEMDDFSLLFHRP